MNRKLARFLMLVLLPVASAAAFAEDRIKFLSPEGVRSTVVGEVVDFTGKGLVVRSRTTKAPSVIPADDVLEVITDQQDGHQRGAEFQKHSKWSDARRELQLGLEAEPRKWVRREIQASLLRCDLATGDELSAGKAFVQLVEQDSKTIFFSLAPLDWESSSRNETELRTAGEWLHHSEPRVRLLGASWLLTNPRASESALTELRALSRAADLHLQRLAQAQQWRLRLDDAPLHSNELLQWERSIEEMPASLRGGPYFLLGQARFARREYESAVAAWMWLPTHFQDHRRWVKISLQRSAEALELAGQTSASRQLRREAARFEND